jgi:alkylhydroperoxidase family enzyme
MISVLDPSEGLSAGVETAIVSVGLAPVYSAIVRYSGWATSATHADRPEECEEVGTGPTPPRRQDSGGSYLPAAKERSALEFARKVVRDRAVAADEGVEQLRRAGYTDGEVGEIVAKVVLR